MKKSNTKGLGGVNCVNFSLDKKSISKSNDSTPSYSMSKKSISKSSGSVNRPVGFEF